MHSWSEAPTQREEVSNGLPISAAMYLLQNSGAARTEKASALLALTASNSRNPT